MTREIVAQDRLRCRWSTYKNHRNLTFRIYKYVGAGLANIFGERTPCEKLADLYPRQGNLLQRNIFSAVYKTSLHFTK
jgi:hypothetical protein